MKNSTPTFEQSCGAEEKVWNASHVQINAITWLRLWKYEGRVQMTIIATKLQIRT